MTVVDLLSRLRAEGIQIWADEDKLQFRSRHGDLPADLRTALRARKAEVLAFLRNAAESRVAGPERFVPTRPGDAFPLSFSQSRMWFVQELHRDNAAYNIYCVARLRGDVDLVQLDAAVTLVVNRHDSLRVTFRKENDQPVQVIGPPREHAITVTDLSTLDADARVRETERITRANIEQAFDLATGPLFRIDVVKLGAAEYLWVENFHHIVVDDWSMKVFTREWMTAYSAARRGVPAGLPPLPVQYPQYCAWQRQQAGGRSERQAEYWRSQLAGALPVLQLPTDRPRPAVQSFAGRHKRYPVPAELYARVKAWSDRRGVTPFITLLSAYAAMLHAFTQQTDIIIGSPIAGRTRREAELLVGCCIGMIVLRVDLSGDPAGAELVDRVQTLCKGAYDHQDVPFERLMEELDIKRDPGRNAIFQTIFTLQNTPLEWAHRSESLDITIDEIDNRTSKMDYCLTLMDTPDGFTGLVEYSTELFDVETIDSMFETFTSAIEAIVTAPNERLGALPLVSAHQRQQLAAWSGRLHCDMASPDALLHAAFERQAGDAPQRTAVVDGRQDLPYGELDVRANELAQRLIARGIGRDAVVALHLPRSLDFVTAVLAVLKSGAAFVALDVAAPADRKSYVIADSQAALVVTTSACASRLPASCTETLCLDRPDSGALHGAGAIRDHRPARPDSLACVVYTSGSTGRPKGVALEHRSLASYVESAIRAYGVTRDDRTLQFADLTVDAPLEEIFPVLSVGGTVVLRSADALDSFERFLTACEQGHVTMISPPTAYWTHLLVDMAARGRVLPSCIRLMILGGGLAKAELMPLWLRVRGHADLVNSYGPTEASVVVSTWRLRADEAYVGGRVPIGRPFENARLFVLNEQRRPVPIGAPGELYIGGRCLARGYLGRPDLTAERFVRHPEDPDARLYRTGDVVRHRHDGQLEFLGRIDSQVKVRGYRVDPGEIEAAIEQHPGVTQAVVLSRERAGEIELVAFVAAPGGSVTTAALRTFLRERVPPFMVPAAFAIVPALPTLAGHKVDRTALPVDALLPETDGTRAAPATALEREVSEIWNDVLHRPGLGVTDDFFDLGGHSLMMMRILSRVRERYGVDMPLAEFFPRPTVRDMVAFIDARLAKRAAPAAPRDAVDLDEEIRLDPAIAPAVVTTPRERGTGVLLTGATGFLGAFLLRELASQTDAAVHCLVRGRDSGDAFARIQRALAHYDLWSESLRDRVVAVAGDLSQPRLGLSPAAFDGLAARVGAIYHAGATVNFVYPYRTLKAANVLGTAEVLRLAVTGATKPVVFVSTTSVAPARGGARPHLATGYDETKWVAERVARLAAARGVPVSVFRPANISGDSRTGACSAGDFFHRFVSGCIQLGASPRVVARLNLVPVDLVSRDIVSCSRGEAASGRTYHMVSASPCPIAEFMAHVRDLGIPVVEERYATWRRRLASLDDSHPLAAIAPLFPDDERAQRETPDDEGDLPGVTYIRYPGITREMVGACVSYLARRGLLGGALDTRIMAAP